MSATAPAETRSAQEIVRQFPVAQASNGVCYASAGEVAISAAELERMVAAVPATIAAALDRKAYYFVPLAVANGDETVVSERYDVALSDRAICHRNVTLGNSQCVFISTRLMDDKFSVAFEFYINVGHGFVERAGISPEFADLVWAQAEKGVRGESSLDAIEFRRQAIPRAGEGASSHPVAINEKAKNDYIRTTFSDAMAIYMLSLYIDVDYYDLREREYPLLAPASLAERLRKVAELFPPNPGYDFALYYRRKS